MSEEKQRDWIAIGVSLASLGISAAVAFNANLLKRDDIRIVMGDGLQIIREKNVFSLQEHHEFTFINSGNRQAVVSGLYGMLVLAIQPGDAAAQCSQDLPLHKSILLDASPIVLKPGEIQIFQAKVSTSYPWKRKDGMLQFREDGVVEGAANYVVCIALNIVTPDSSSEKWTQPLYSLPATGEDREAFDKARPLNVLQRTFLGF
ncbi:hypothetical protein KQX62_14030 [Rhodopseudomonas palustris]|uniref:Uncharacterized protein n=1 Tax=Rhodopseudomonas palustris TaxID=1076 RepID=A0AAX3DUM4_RHOPL|nr:hypothetical protein [Rhodopseudomonas palustris]UYO37860.1 hypothetical protein KQX62_14030 [Rhodopseudomonas palustris]